MIKRIDVSYVILIELNFKKIKLILLTIKNMNIIPITILNFSYFYGILMKKIWMRIKVLLMNVLRKKI